PASPRTPESTKSMRPAPASSGVRNKRSAAVVVRFRRRSTCRPIAVHRGESGKDKRACVPPRRRVDEQTRPWESCPGQVWWCRLGFWYSYLEFSGFRQEGNKPSGEHGAGAAA